MKSKVCLLCIPLVVFTLVSCRSNDRTVLFCEENYPIVFQYPENLHWGDTVGLSFGGEYFHINIGIEENTGGEIDATHILNERLASTEKSPIELLSPNLDGNDVAIAVFPVSEPLFPDVYREPSLNYQAIALLPKYHVYLVVFQDSADDSNLLPILELILGSMRLKTTLDC